MYKYKYIYTYMHKLYLFAIVDFLNGYQTMLLNHIHM